DPVPIGGSVLITFDLVNESSRAAEVMVDCRIHFVKARGKTSPKVFKIRALEMPPHATVSLSKKVSLAEMTIRRHYAGHHAVELMLNGVTTHFGHFELLDR